MRRSTFSHSHAGYLFLMLAVALAGAACAKLLAPTDASITLTASTTNVSTGTPTSIVATAVNAAGDPVEDGTSVNFQTTFGVLNPPQVRTAKGVATARFSASQPGTATITATSGSVQSNALDITVGPAVALTLTASPTTATVNTTVVTFTATISPASTAIDHYVWVFGDQQTTTTTTGTATHIYTTAGTMTVRVTAVAADGSQPTAQTQVIVQAP